LGGAQGGRIGIGFGEPASLLGELHDFGSRACGQFAMRVVRKTPPRCNLAIIGRLHLLIERYGTIMIPSMVRQELDALL